MISDRFDVVLVPFPFSDRSAAKPRPALVLSAEKFNATDGHTILAMITRAVAISWQSDVSITDLATAGLNAPSVVRFKLFTLNNDLVRRRIGMLAAADLAAIRRRLAELL
ncbi:MAG: type II toxin-antitoxin system PemK/MazF family toxin [Alphaproteobacteria bacterium]|nr:type II toxin-antitoxin system PemK/MazF family toxin [Alphaproteobacteria bacterium]